MKTQVTRTVSIYASYASWWNKEDDPPPWPLTTSVISRFSTKSIVFYKTFQMSLTEKKVNYIFEKPLSLVFFKLKKIGIWFEQQTEVGSTIPLDTKNTLIIFLSAIAVMQVIFWTEDNSVLFLIAGTDSAANSKSL